MNKQRIMVAALTLSATALVGRAVQEGYTDEAVIPVPGDVPTLGFGTTQGVKLGDKTTPVKALQRAYADMQTYEGAIKRCVTAPLHQAEYDAYAELAYNIGPTAFCGSTLVKRLNAQEYRAACDQILVWKMFRGFDCSTPGNKVCSGLWKDRLRLHQQCMVAQ
jgi:lysozyme